MYLYYSTHDGHAQKIAQHIASRLSAIGIKAAPQNLANKFPSLDDIKTIEPVVVIAALRYGFHLPEASRFLKLYKEWQLPNPLVVVSVNLVARKPKKNSPETNPYLRRWLKRHKIKPVLAAAIAGKLDYPRYDRLDRNIIRLIMMITGGPTDPRVTVEFTDWDKVDDLAKKIADLQKVTTQHGLSANVSAITHESLSP